MIVNDPTLNLIEARKNLFSVITSKYHLIDVSFESTVKLFDKPSINKIMHLKDTFSFSI